MSKDYKLCIFDCDGTLTTSKSGETFRKSADDWKWLPGRLEKIKELQEAEKRIAVCTNQGGLIWHEATEEDKYPTPIMLGEALKHTITMISAQSPTKQDPWYISLYDQRAVDMINKNIEKEILALSEIAGHSTDPQAAPEYETPEEILERLQKELFEALQQFNVRISIDPSWRKPEPGMLLHAIQYFQVGLEETLFVGDRPEDEKAAKAAGVDFMWANDFFKQDQDTSEDISPEADIIIQNVDPAVRNAYEEELINPSPRRIEDDGGPAIFA